MDFQNRSTRLALLRARFELAWRFRDPLPNHAAARFQQLSVDFKLADRRPSLFSEFAPRKIAKGLFLLARLDIIAG